MQISQLWSTVITGSECLEKHIHFAFWILFKWYFLSIFYDDIKLDFIKNVAMWGVVFAHREANKYVIP